MSFADVYDFYWNQYVDPRTKDFPFVASAYQVPLLVALYGLLVFRCIPSYMERRPAYELKTVTRLYNLLQIVVNGYISYNTYGLVRDGELSLGCTPTDFSFDSTPYKMAVLIWIGMMLKITDLLDTIMFALKKKRNQITFLHVYHHVSTLLIWWILTKYAAGGMLAIPCAINCFVHVVMYGYYFLSTVRSMKVVSLMIKPFITILQLVQFAILQVYLAQAFLPSCEYSSTCALVVFLQVTVNFALFINFYRNTYIKPAKKEI